MRTNRSLPVPTSPRPALSPSRPLPLWLSLSLLFALLALSELPAAPTPPAADVDVLPADWMGLADDLIFFRVQLPTASLPLGFTGRPLGSPARANVSVAELPTFRLPHYLSHPDSVTVEPAGLPVCLAWRAPAQPVELRLAEVPQLTLPRFVSHPVSVAVEIAVLPLNLTGRPLTPPASVDVSTAELPQFSFQRFVSHPDLVAVEIAIPPLSPTGRPLTPLASVDVATAELPQFAFQRFVSHPDLVVVETAILPPSPTDRPPMPSTSVEVSTAELPQFALQRFVAHPELVAIETASLPQFNLPHFLSQPDSVVVETASLPLGFSGRSPTLLACVDVSAAELPQFAPPHYASRPDPILLPLAQLPREVLTLTGPASATALSCPDDLKFVMSLAVDHQGNLWAGCEDSGIYRYAPSTAQWQQFTTKDGLGDDNAYSIAVDHLGRVWAGHLNHGVSVFNGRTWQNYEVVAGLSRDGTLAGPLGERIFKIAVAPAGDVWIATSAGLARYSVSHPALSPSPTPALSSEAGTWSYYTRAEGLPSDQAQALAFAPDGTLYVGTQCDGIAIASPTDDYKAWRTVQGPAKMPTDPHGDGLPTNLINDVLVTKSGTVYASTTLGLAESKDQGRTWQYWRGADYADKVRGLYGGPPTGWQEQEVPRLAEDYITCLAQDPAGNLWIGYRQKGYELLQPETADSPAAASSQQTECVNALITLPNALPIAGIYGAGVHSAAISTRLPASSAPQVPISNPEISNSAIPPFPTTAQPPDRTELAQILQQAKAPKDPPAPNGATALGQDWRTQGAWVGRYGRQYTILCAANSPFNHKISHSVPYLVDEDIGPNHDPNDVVRNWIHWKRSAEPRVLYDPCLGYRREAEWDDHGEIFAQTHEGPDLWVRVDIPTGTHRLSLYFVNPNGHEDGPRLRDYLVEIKRWEPDEAQRLAGPTLAKLRVHDFWGGQYSSFLLAGSGSYVVHIAKQSSMNTILSGVLLDKFDGTALPSENDALPLMGGLRYDPPKPGAYPPPLAAAGAAWDALQQRRYCPNQSIEAQRAGILLYRFAAQTGASEKLLANWRWSLRLWTQTDRVEWAAAVRKGRETYAAFNGLQVEKGYDK